MPITQSTKPRITSSLRMVQDSHGSSWGQFSSSEPCRRRIYACVGANEIGYGNTALSAYEGWLSVVNYMKTHPIPDHCAQEAKSFEPKSPSIFRRIIHYITHLEDLK